MVPWNGAFVDVIYFRIISHHCAWRARLLFRIWYSLIHSLARASTRNLRITQVNFELFQKHVSVVKLVQHNITGYVTLHLATVSGLAYQPTPALELFELATAKVAIDEQALVMSVAVGSIRPCASLIKRDCASRLDGAFERSRPAPSCSQERRDCTQ